MTIAEFTRTAVAPPWGKYAWKDGRYFYNHKSLDHVSAFFVRQTYVPIFDLIHRQTEAVDPIDWLLETVRMQNNAAFLQGFFDYFERRGCFLANPFSVGERLKHKQGEVAAACSWRVRGCSSRTRLARRWRRRGQRRS